MGSSSRRVSPGFPGIFMSDHHSYRFESTQSNNVPGFGSGGDGSRAIAPPASAARRASSVVSREADSHTPEPAEQCERLASPLCAAVVHVTEVLSSVARAPVAAARLYRAPADLRGLANHTRLSPPVLWNDARSVLPVQWQTVLRTWSRWPELPGGLFAELAYRPIAYGVHSSNGGDAVVREAFARETQRARAGGAPLPAAMVVAVLPVDEECWAAVGMLRGMGERSEVNATMKLKVLLTSAAAALQRGYEFEMHQAWHGSLFGAMSHAELRARLDDLSRTEEAVLRELLDGKPTEKEVAQRLHRSHHTIHVHVKNIYRKLGVSSRKELRKTYANFLPSGESKPHTQHNAAA